MLGSRTRLTAALVTMSTVIVGLSARPVGALPTQSDPITYVYDPLGRLEAVIDPAVSNGLATYSYDAVGNLTGITRQSTTTTRIVDLDRRTGKVGDRVTIYGTAFSATPTQNVVRFNGSTGTPATVISASTTTLTVTVPTGAATGPIFVSSPSGSSTSTQTFTVAGASGPTISSFSPNNGVAGTSVTVAGTNFDATSPASNNVFINRMRAAVTSATATSLTFLVPPSATSGAVTVQTYRGHVASAGDFIAPPSPYVAADVQSTARVTPGGSGSVNITTANKVALILFDGSRDDPLFVSLSASTIAGAQISLYDPFGYRILATAIGTSGGYIDGVTLPEDGTYTILVDPTGTNVGSVTASVYNPQDVTGTIVPGGPTVSLTTTVPGQNMQLTFEGTTNQRISLRTFNESGFGCCQYLRIFNPDGTQLLSNYDWANRTIEVTLTQTGTHRIVYDPDGAKTGSLSFQLYDVSGSGAVAQAETSSPPGVERIGSSAPSPSGTSPTPRGAGDRPPAARTRLTASAMSQYEAPGVEAWAPTVPGDFVTDRQASPLADLAPLKAEPNITALAGQVLKLNGEPLAGVTLELGKAEAESDATGRFLIEGIPAGDQVLEIDGKTANGPGIEYGFYEVGVDIEKHVTNTLDWTIWMTPIDTSTAVEIESPTDREVVLTSPSIPGLEVHIPKGALVTDEDGEAVDELTLTPIPVDRPPFPLPPFVEVPVYFTVQPGGAYVDPDGAWIVYPNYTGLAAGTRVDFWQYEPDEEGWHIYGHGTVTDDGTQIVPDRDTRVWEFSGAMINSGRTPPGDDGDCHPATPVVGASGNDAQAQFAGDPQGTGTYTGTPTCANDPVDPATGLFSHREVDLELPGSLPLTLDRFYRQRDTNVYAFGLGMMPGFEVYLWSANQYQEADLILPGQRRIHFVRTSPGTGFTDAVFEADRTPGPWFGSTMAWNGRGWDLVRPDGLVFVFGENAPLQAIRDRYGNRLVVMREGGSQGGRITHLISSSGRWLSFTYGTNNLITEASDNLGRKVLYTYDTNSPPRLIRVADANQSVVAARSRKYISYTWEPVAGSSAVTAIADPRGVQYIRNVYNGDGRVSRQTLATGGPVDFTYTLVGGSVRQTEITGPNGSIRRVTFDPSGLMLTDTTAVGTPMERTLTYAREPGTNLVSSITDSFHNRRTDFGYDAFGRTTRITRLAGTPTAVTTSFTYDLASGDLATVTDPLSHTVTYRHDGRGCLASVEDATHRESLLSCTPEGLLRSVTDPLSNETRFGYSRTDLVSVTDPAGNESMLFVDGAGRVLSLTDPLGNRTVFQYDNLGSLTKVTNTLGGTTSVAYDVNGNPTLITDPKGNKTTLTYNGLNLVDSRTDGLGKQETFIYDGLGNLTQLTDRKGQVTELRYGPTNLPTFVGFKKVTSGGTTTYESSASFTFDPSGRLTKIDDTAGGVIDRTYDDLDRLTSESSPRGTVGYAYDDASRRTSMTVSGQSGDVTYGYDDANRTTQIAQGGSAVTIAYDQVGRRDVVTLPNGTAQDYGYSACGGITSIEYRNGPATVGDVRYTYDALNRPTSLFGSLASTQLPTATLTGKNVPTYNANNQLTKWNGTAITYDLNGNMLSDGSKAYTWNARDELTEVKSGTASIGSFAYDGLGRRIRSTISGVITRYLYDGLNVLQEQDGAGAVTANLLTGLRLDQTFRRTSGGATRSLLTDALGSVLGLADGSGAIRTSYSYEPFGRTAATGDADTNPFRFTGRENDGPTGLYFFRARYYSPTFQRFVSEDPGGIAGSGVNLYAYVGNGPTQFVDPLGLQKECSGGWFDVELNLIVLKFTFDIGGSCGMVHTSEMGVGLGFPGVSIGKGFEDDVCAGVEASAGGNWGPVGFGGELEGGADEEGGGAWTGGAGVNVGPIQTPVEGGVYLTFGDC
jgi:RHS repeat-associated protein